MLIQQKKFTKSHNWELLKDNSFDPATCQLVLAFGSRTLLEDPTIFENIRNDYPNARIVMSSTAGEIHDTQVNEETVSLTAIFFEKARIEATGMLIAGSENSRDAGRRLAQGLDPTNLKNVMVISDGQKVNGTELVKGLQETLPKDTIITGGLAGDGSRFQKTLVGLDERPGEARIVIIGFYGDDLQISYGSVGGWDPFGPERLITKSHENILYELDGKAALDIYKMYLGEAANELPGSGLLFPLSIRRKDEEPVVRTILGINEQEKSLVFAGNMPQGSYARLMKANFDRLIEGASYAAQNSILQRIKNPDLAILISCVGRKLVLDQRIEEEVEVVRKVYGDNTAITGFYSYGEISPSLNFMKCELHNQTMTITTFSENE